MSYQRVMKTGFPIRKGEDDDTLVWLTRESFENVARGDGLVIEAFTDLGELNPADIVPPAAEKAAADAWGVQPSDIVWRGFEAVAVRPVVERNA